jgi:hypothetical protein
MNFIQKYYINRRLLHFVKERKIEQAKISPFNALKEICVIATYQEEEKYKELMEGIDYLTKKGKKVFLMCYLPDKKIPEIMENKLDISFVYKKDINFLGLMSSYAQQELGCRHYDLLIDADTQCDELGLYMKSCINADLRVGRNKQCYTYYDLTLCVDDTFSIKEYFLNVETYITKLQGN